MYSLKGNAVLYSGSSYKSFTSNSVEESSALQGKLSDMVYQTIKDEFPFLQNKNKDTLCGFVLYLFARNTDTIQTMENVLSCIKEVKVKHI